MDGGTSLSFICCMLKTDRLSIKETKKNLKQPNTKRPPLREGPKYIVNRQFGMVSVPDPCLIRIPTRLFLPGLNCNGDSVPTTSGTISSVLSRKSAMKKTKIKNKTP